MGFNTTVVVLNDALHAIEQDVNFGPRLAQAIKEIGGHNDRHIDVSAMGHVNAATVIETHHADGFAVVAVGGNMGVELGFGGGYRNKNLEILKCVAESMGYVVHKKPARKKR